LKFGADAGVGFVAVRPRGGGGELDFAVGLPLTNSPRRND